MIFNRASVLAHLFRREREFPKQVAARWQAAHDADDQLAQDLIRLSGLLAIEDFTRIDQLTGERVGGVDADQVMYERGRQDFAKQILALMHLSPFELNQLMEASNVS